MIRFRGKNIEQNSDQRYKYRATHMIQLIKGINTEQSI